MDDVLNREIQEIPDMPDDIMKAIHSKRLILFLGAGISVSVGVKSWLDSLNELLKFSISSKKIDVKEAKEIISRDNYYSSFEKLKSKMNNEFESLLKKIITPNLNSSIQEEFKEKVKKLLDLKPVAVVTTNVDELLEKTKLFENIYYKEDCNPQNISNDVINLFCIHGKLNDNVFTLQDKDTLYKNKNFEFFLHNLQGSYCILFLGYSLNDNDVFEGFHKFTDYKEVDRNYHYALMPNNYKKIDEDLLVKRYKIKVIKYDNSSGKYENFWKTIDNWVSKIKVIEGGEKMSIYKNFKLIDEALEKNLLNDEIFRLINEVIYSNYFFERVKNVKWFFPLKEKGFFSPEKAPVPKPADKEGYWTIPRWNILDYLEKVSEQVNVPGNEKYADELLKIIKDVTYYHIKNNKCLDNYYTWWYFVKILSNLPDDKITSEIIDLIPHWLDSRFINSLQSEEILEKLLPKFLNSNNPEGLEKAEKIIEIITRIKWVPKYSEQQKKEIFEKYKHIFEKPENERTEDEKIQISLFNLDEKEPRTLLSNSAWLLETPKGIRLIDIIAEKSNEGIIHIFADRLREIFDEIYKTKEGGEKYDLSYIWFKSLYNPPRYLDSAEEVFTFILRNILLKKSKNDTELTKKILESFLSEYEYPLFKRFVLFVIGNNWDLYKEFFWKMIDKDEKAELFNDPIYEPEVYKLLESNISIFNLEEKEKIKEIIETNVPDEIDSDNKKYYIAYRRQKWYSALKSDDDFLRLYEEYKNVTKKEEKIDFSGIQTRVGPGPSPLTQEEILNKPNFELAVFLKEFKTKDWWEGPTVNALSDVLKVAVQENPEKFVNDLNIFLDTGYLYVYDMLWGLRDALENKKLIDWEKVFDFIEKYISSEDFWNDKYKVETDEWEANHLWVVGMISELIRVGTYDDLWAFSEKYFQKVQDILFFILDRIMVEKEKISKDYSTINDFITYALNSTFGKVTETLFLFALRIKVLEEKTKTKQPVSWEVSIKNRYEKLMDDEIIETYVWFGRYLPNFYYLDKEWTENKIKTIDNDKGYLWEAFMEGYLFTRKIFDELYVLMKKHYEKAINYQFKHEITSTRLIQHICLEYLRGIEDINNREGLFRKLLDKWEFYQIEEMISFFWSYEINTEKKPNKSVVLDRNGKLNTIIHEQIEENLIEDEETSERNRIIDFWRWIYENKYKEKNENEFTDEDKKILSKLSLLTAFLPEINSENFKWLRLSVLFFDEYVHSSLFIEYLDNLKDKTKSPKLIGEIFLEILKIKKLTPYIGQDKVKSIVEFLYQRGVKKEADEICNSYAERGFLFLRQIYEKYNNI